MMGMAIAARANKKEGYKKDITILAVRGLLT